MRGKSSRRESTVGLGRESLEGYGRVGDRVGKGMRGEGRGCEGTGKRGAEGRECKV